MTNRKGVLFVISAPTGGGKTTIAMAALKTLSPTIPISKVITYTTRPPRTGEINGKDYHFVERNDFLQKKQANFFLETTVYDNHFYGSPRTIFDDMKQGKSFIMVTDRPGALVIKQLAPEASLIWITVPNLETIENWLHMRWPDKNNLVQQRLAIAEQEIAIEQQKPAFDFHVMNEAGKLQEAVDQVIEIIVRETTTLGR